MGLASNAGAVNEIAERLPRACRYAVGIALDIARGEWSIEEIRDLAVSIADELHHVMDALEALGIKMSEAEMRELREREEELERAEEELLGSGEGE
jgi:hypothetical protein